jgi:hypothetical protein
MIEKKLLENKKKIGSKVTMLKNICTRGGQHRLWWFGEGNFPGYSGV